MVWCADAVRNHNRVVSSNIPLSSLLNTEFSTSELTELVLCCKLSQTGSQTSSPVCLSVQRRFGHFFV